MQEATQKAVKIKSRGAVHWYFYMPRFATPLFLLCVTLTAAPKLRMSTAAVGPVFIVTGQSGPVQSVDTANIGDGVLTLTASANVPWITASIGAVKACTLAASCRPVQMGLSTAGLTRGSYTGLVTVSDPNAIDAPQTITVTVQIGSAIPDSMELYVPPGGSTSGQFRAPRIFWTVSNPAGGPTLTISTPGGGSFDFSFPYDVTVRAPAGTVDNDYQGSFTVTGSSFVADNKTVPVTAHVTSQPIAKWAPSSLTFRIAQGAAKATQAILFSNAGLGTLAISGATGNPSWLTAAVQGNVVLLTADPTGMNPGAYQATISVASNARNGPTKIPVELDVLTTGPPLTSYQGVLDNALFGVGDAVAPGGIVALFGEQLTTGPAASAASLPLKTTLGGATVFVNDQPAPVYYVAAGQIDFLIPYATPRGDAVVRVDRDGQRGNSVSVKIERTAPRLLRLGIGDYGIVVLSDLTTFPLPPTPGLVTRAAKAGVDAIVLYALGLGQTNPAAVDGQAATATQVSPPRVIFGESVIPGSGVPADPLYAGLTPGLVGLYQINVVVPARSPRGDAIPVYLDLGGVLSNQVNIAIQ